MGLVAGVDDRPIEGGLQADVALHVVGALAHLEAGALGALADADAPGPRDDGAGDEERDEDRGEVAEGEVPAHQVVLVGAVGRTLAVDVVLVQNHLAGHDSPGALGQGDHGPPGDQLAGAVPHDGVVGREDLRGGVLGVGVVDVQTGAVGQHHGGGARKRGLDRVGARPGPPRGRRRVRLLPELCGAVAERRPGRRPPHRGAVRRGTAGRRTGPVAGGVAGGRGAGGVVGEQTGVGGGPVKAPAAQVGERVLALVVPAHGPRRSAVRAAHARPRDHAVGLHDPAGHGDGAGVGVARLKDPERGLNADGPRHRAESRCGLAHAPSFDASAGAAVRRRTRRMGSPRRPTRRAQSSGPVAPVISSF